MKHVLWLVLQVYGTVPWTVLDEQRRMRPAIAALTRGDYTDLVAIKDHPVTLSRRLGDVAGVDASLQLQRVLWPDQGRTVPGDYLNRKPSILNAKP